MQLVRSGLIVIYTAFLGLFFVAVLSLTNHLPFGLLGAETETWLAASFVYLVLYVEPWSFTFSSQASIFFWAWLYSSLVCLVLSPYRSLHWLRNIALLVHTAAAIMYVAFLYIVTTLNLWSVWLPPAFFPLNMIVFWRLSKQGLGACNLCSVFYSGAFIALLVGPLAWLWLSLPSFASLHGLMVFSGLYACSFGLLWKLAYYKKQPSLLRSLFVVLVLGVTIWLVWIFFPLCVVPIFLGAELVFFKKEQYWLYPPHPQAQNTLPASDRPASHGAVAETPLSPENSI